jgi:hypothetical protein
MVKAKLNLSLCLTKYNAVKTYVCLIKHHTMKMYCLSGSTTTRILNLATLFLEEFIVSQPIKEISISSSETDV